MNIDKYALKAESSLTVFEFISEGPNGNIRKLIHFQETNEPGVYNLAFGDKQAGLVEINDLAISNNGDSEKILATVVSALYAFFAKYPDSFVYATGSTRARTRLYRMGITRFYDEIKTDFYLFGQVGDDFHEFEIGREYSGFLAQRKFD
ncbi:DUF6934 family protein [Hymenobacter sp.]|uniref:DUF6934 family protein n=1 Tax=Hymenobacter sp. TaxID=1898978 RepID=UPI00286B19F9|nr:hypothetical protein [Hymenobacter sp.]